MGIIKEIKHTWQEGRLLPVLGAGLSVDSNLPTWEGLIKNLLNYLLHNDKLPELQEYTSKSDFENNFLERISKLNPIISARFIKTIMPNPEEFSHAVYYALYYDIISEPIPSATVDSLTLLSTHSKKYLTYNFDNVLELAFQKKKIETQSIFNQHQDISPEKIKIYHPHGYLPYGDEIVWLEHYQNNDIVFSEDDYHNQYNEPFSWGNTIQLNCLYEYSALYIGLSVNDPNLRRIIEIANKQSPKNHYIFLLEEDDLEYSETWLKIEERIFNELGLKVLWIDDYGEIKSIIQEIVAN